MSPRAQRCVPVCQSVDDDRDRVWLAGSRSRFSGDGLQWSLRAETDVRSGLLHHQQCPKSQLPGKGDAWREERATISSPMAGSSLSDRLHLPGRIFKRPLRTDSRERVHCTTLRVPSSPSSVEGQRREIVYSEEERSHCLLGYGFSVCEQREEGADLRSRPSSTPLKSHVSVRLSPTGLLSLH
ncbi:hypothetical protein Q8A73_007153 [Channa argus]|nr:hypothetical protein Q8A73_007153 [Channa argus]